MLYAPLPHSRCTRLLKIVEVTPEGESKLTLKLSVVDLANVSAKARSRTPAELSIVNVSSDESDFDALSYTWGSPFSTPELAAAYSEAHDVKITVTADQDSHKHVLSIGRNLYEALCAIHQLGRRRYLWVDALSINQADPIEKSGHVQYMSDIYSKAACVIVWPGPDDPDLPTFGHVRSLIAKIKAIPAAYLLGDPSQASSKQVHKPGTLEITGIQIDGGGVKGLILPADKLRSLHRFHVRRRYFARAWIVQEIVLSHRCFIILGNQFVDLSDLMGLVTSQANWVNASAPFRYHEPTQETSGVGAELGALYTYWTRLSYLEYDSDDENEDDEDWTGEREAENGTRRLYLNGVQENVSQFYGAKDEMGQYLALLEEHLTSGHSRHCTDPRDAVYSCFGYLDRLISLTETPIKVDYTMSVEEVYTSVTSKLLRVLPHRTILSAVCDRQVNTDASQTAAYAAKLPSWVPDFSRCRAVVSNAFMGMIYNDRARLGLNQPPTYALPKFTAGFCSDSIPAPSIDGRKLTLKARYCGHVTTMCRPSIDWNSISTLTQNIRAWFYTVLQLLGICMLFDVDEKELAGRTLIESLFRVICVPSPLLGWEPYKDFNVLISALIRQTFWQSAYLVPRGGTKPAWLEEFHGHMYFLAEELADQSCFPSLDEIRETEEAAANPQNARHELMSALATYGKREDIQVLMNELHTVFITNNRLLGRVANKLQVGDELWLICDARSPFVLRPAADGTYTLLGEALVDGAMFGELIENGIAGEPKLITIV